jgi:beta-N-acetylhexosaminidase
MRPPVLVMLALVLAGLAAGCGGAAVERPRPVPASERTQARNATLSRAVGRRIVSGMDGTFPSRSLRARVRRGEVGGVILFGPNIGPRLGRAIAALQQAARAGGNEPLLIAVDQEGGTVKRLPSLPPSRPPAAMTAATAGAEGAATGRALHALGINVDLAPVADVSHGSFLGSRSFGGDPDAVAAAACAFAAGLQSAGVSATLKHFPGLGRTRRTTDQQRVRVRASARALRADLAPYRRCGARTNLVMVSNATYPALDSRRPAVFSRRIVRRLLHDELKSGALTITDTLAAPGVSSPSAAVRAIRAGVDLLLYPDERSSARGYGAIVRAVHGAVLSRAELFATATAISAHPPR